MSFIKKLKSRLEDGSSLIEGMLTLSSLVLFLGILVSVFQILIVAPELSYIAYESARAAVVEENLEAAQKRASHVGKKIFDSELTRATLSNGKVELKVKEGKWLKGNHIDCLVTVDVETVFPIFKGTYGEKLTMMIERPASEAEGSSGSSSSSGTGDQDNGNSNQTAEEDN